LKAMQIGFDLAKKIEKIMCSRRTLFLHKKIKPEANI